MLEKRHNYPAAITADGSKEPERAQRTAIRWITSVQKQTGGAVLLYVPQRGSLDRMNSLLSSYARSPGVVVGTWRTRTSWGGGPVLAAWPTQEKLAEIAEHPQTRALCVIPWLLKDTAAWEKAVQPERLDGAGASAGVAALDPVVVRGLQALTGMVNHANNLAGTLDHRDAVAVLRTLHKGGYPLPADDVYAWALGLGWPARGALRLRDMAAKIDAGRTVRLQGRWPLRDDVLDTWRAHAADPLEEH